MAPSTEPETVCERAWVRLKGRREYERELLRAKERAEAWDRLLKSHAVVPDRAAMFEDMPHNLEAPHALGMTTVLVHSSYIDHPIQLKIRQWKQPPEHIHHMTENLCGFLESRGPWPEPKAGR